MDRGIFWADDPPKARQHFSLQEKIIQSLSKKSQLCTLTHMDFHRAGSKAEEGREPSARGLWTHHDIWDGTEDVPVPEKC